MHELNVYIFSFFFKFTQMKQRLKPYADNESKIFHIFALFKSEDFIGRINENSITNFDSIVHFNVVR